MEVTQDNFSEVGQAKKYLKNKYGVKPKSVELISEEQYQDQLNDIEFDSALEYAQDN